MNVSSWRTGDSPAEGSSRSSTVGSIISARAIASDWRSPPESAPALLVAALVQDGEEVPHAVEALA